MHKRVAGDEEEVQTVFKRHRLHKGDVIAYAAHKSLDPARLLQLEFFNLTLDPLAVKGLSLRGPVGDESEELFIGSAIGGI